MRIFLTALFVALSTVAICACAASGAKGDDKAVPKITYCELIKHPEKYDDRVVEVSAIFENGFEKSYLYDDEGCKNGLSKSETWVGFDKSFVMDGDSEEAKTTVKSPASASGKLPQSAVSNAPRDHSDSDSWVAAVTSSTS